MTIQEREKILAVAVPSVLLAGFLVFIGYGWLQEHDARLTAEAQTGQQQKQIEGLQQQQADARKMLNQQLATLERERRQPATAARLIGDATAMLPGLPAPLEAEAAPKDPALPNAPASENVIVPEADFSSIQQARIDCQEDAVKLASCQSIEEDGQKQIQLAEQQRDEWKSAAKGGSIWHRALGAAKWFAIGAGAGAGLYAAGHHR